MIAWVEDVKAHFHKKCEVYGSWEGKLPRSEIVFSFKKLAFELFKLRFEGSKLYCLVLDFEKNL
jgi:hypothetical protein